MIGVVAGDDLVIGVDEVIDWLDYYKKDWERIIGSGREKLAIYSSNPHENNYTKYSSIWYRGFIRNRVLSNKLLKVIDSENENIIELNKIIFSEINFLKLFKVQC